METETKRTSEQHVIISWLDRHERIRNIANELDEYLEKMETRMLRRIRRSKPKYLPAALRELHTLRDYCEQLRCEAESLKNGADGFGKGVEEVQA